eukprot:4725563-Amphidinium_carterae.2
MVSPEFACQAQHKERVLRVGSSLQRIHQMYSTKGSFICAGKKENKTLRCASRCEWLYTFGLKSSARSLTCGNVRWQLLALLSGVSLLSHGS